jgi:hypothetical protein
MDFEKELAGEIQNARQKGIDASGIWELFENATSDQQLMIFERTLETGVLIDEYAFEFLGTIRGDCDLESPEGRAAYTGFLDQLREQAPKLYQQSSHYYHRDLISFAIIEGRWGDLPDLLTDYTSGDHLDLFTMVVAQLKYHGQVKILVEAMEAAYPKIEASSQYLPWASEEFAGKLMEVMLVDYLETSVAPRPDDPEFLAATAYLPSWKEGWLEWFVPTVTQPEPTEWKLSDFAGNPRSEDWLHKFATMQVECIAALWRAGVPLTRGLLAWRKWGEIFHDQHKTAQKFRKRQKRKQKAVDSSLSRYLIPQAKQMDQTLGESFSLMGGEPYEVAAALELMPAYLDFLTDFGLVQPYETQQALQQIKPLVEQTPQILKYYEIDPVAIQNMLAAWDI